MELDVRLVYQYDDRGGRTMEKDSWPKLTNLRQAFT